MTRKSSLTLLYVAVFTSFMALTSCSKKDDSADSGNASASTTNKTAHVHPETDITIFKTPTCGCCKLWVDHLAEANFTATVTDMDSLHEIKQKYGITEELQSCHTAVIDDYVMEGHIPSSIMRRFLNNPPQGAKGLAVPGMPLGSPGMDTGSQSEAYDVLLIKADGTTQVFAHVAAK